MIGNKSYYPANEEDHAHMRMRKNQNLERFSAAEEWFNDLLVSETNNRWGRQKQWGFRLFDFWCHELGAAVEVDGREHNKFKDRVKDKSVWERSRIIVYRVRNFNEQDASKALSQIENCSNWNDRRRVAGMKPIRGA